METSQTPPSAAIRYEPDGYDLKKPKLMGRQVAGNGFLRAAVAGRGEAPLYAYTPRLRSAEHFSRTVAEIDSSATTRWIKATRLNQLAEVGALYLSDPGLGTAAMTRLRVGCASYSLVGVTHTLATDRVMDDIAGYVSAPVMPWDALICTSRATERTVRDLLDAQADYLRWRLGSSLRATLPQLPVIPLGVHCQDFEFSLDDRVLARSALEIDDSEVVVLFTGRLAFHAKAHPHAMYAALQSVAERSGRQIVLLQCGWSPNEYIRDAFTDGAERFCPQVRSLFADGREIEILRRCWAAADIFVSLSDSIQETFGLTPIEAMASGLPVVVTDWDGYKDTVRDGIDGFRIRTWMPESGAGQRFALAYEVGDIDYDLYSGLNCQVVSVDMEALAQRLTDLVLNPSLRRTMGEAGRARAREAFDWNLLFRQYQTLYGHLADICRKASSSMDIRGLLAAAPRNSPGRMDPFQCFGHYPTDRVGLRTLATLRQGADLDQYNALKVHPLFNYFSESMPGPDKMRVIFHCLTQGPCRVEQLVDSCGSNDRDMIIAVSALAKMGMVSLS